MEIAQNAIIRRGLHSAHFPIAILVFSRAARGSQLRAQIARPLVAAFLAPALLAIAGIPDYLMLSVTAFATCPFTVSWTARSPCPANENGICALI